MPSNTPETQALFPCLVEGCSSKPRVQWQEAVAYVECAICGDTGPLGWTEDEAVAGWNARHRISHSLPGDVGMREFAEIVAKMPCETIGVEDLEGGCCAPCRARAALTPSALSPEHCQRCGHNNPSWSAPSPLWNAVIRGGSIDGEPKFDDMVCASCFMELAEQAGIASNWRVDAQRVNVPLETTTPTGRVWDADQWLWGHPDEASPAQPVDETERLHIKALRAAEQFIVNGVEMGYIRMPDAETPDTAHDTLPLIRAALTDTKGDRPMGDM